MSVLARRLQRLEGLQYAEPMPESDPDMKLFYLRRIDGTIDAVKIDDFI